MIRDQNDINIDDQDIYVSIDDLPQVLSNILGISTTVITQQNIKEASLAMRVFLPGLQSGYFIIKVEFIL